MTLGNTQLINYGIEQWAEKCDLMFHVSVVTKRVFSYEPIKALDAIRSGNFPAKTARTGNIITAMGYTVPTSAIKGCRGTVIPVRIFHNARFSEFDSTTVKGRKAEYVVREMIRGGQLSLNLDVISVSDFDLQVDGLDLIPKQATNPQVKCDWRAGPRELGGTGNLFIQTKECNPLKLF
jgi:hypothetical protein